MQVKLVAGFRTRRMDNASFTLTSFVSTLQQCSSSTGYNKLCPENMGREIMVATKRC